MNFTDLADVMPSFLDSGVAVEMISGPGGGKSEFAGQIAAATGRAFKAEFLGLKAPTDIMGFMIPTKDDRSGRMRSVWTDPDWMFLEDGSHMSDHSKGVLFLDEFGQAQGDVKKAAAELLLNGRVGPHRMPKGWSILAASNRAKDRSGVTKSLAFVENRRCRIDIDLQVAPWQVWADKAGVHPVLRSFADTHPGTVFRDSIPDTEGPFTTPRSLVMLGRMLTKRLEADGSLPTDAAALETAKGLLGEGDAMQFFNTVKMAQELPPFRDVVRDPVNTPLPASFGAQMLMAWSLAHNVSKGDADQVLTYVDRMKLSFSATFLKAAVGRERSLIMTPAFTRWCAKNGQLMTIVSGLDKAK